MMYINMSEGPNNKQRILIISEKIERLNIHQITGQMKNVVDLIAQRNAVQNSLTRNEIEYSSMYKL